jgi:hypothetical protein
MTVIGDFSVRGGISTVVTASYEKPAAAGGTQGRTRIEGGVTR